MRHSFPKDTPPSILNTTQVGKYFVCCNRPYFFYGSQFGFAGTDINRWKETYVYNRQALNKVFIISQVLYRCPEDVNDTV